MVFSSVCRTDLGSGEMYYVVDKTLFTAFGIHDAQEIGTTDLFNEPEDLSRPGFSLRGNPTRRTRTEGYPLVGDLPALARFVGSTRLCKIQCRDPCSHDFESHNLRLDALNSFLRPASGISTSDKAQEPQTRGLQQSGLGSA